MHTITMIVAGLMLLALFHIGRHRLANVVGGAAGYITVFLIVWLVISVINMLIGVVSAGYPLGTELGIMVVVFGVPAAAAFAVRHRFAAPS